MTQDSLSPSTRLARSAGIVMFAFLLSQLTGLAAKIIIGAAFPAGLDLDAFYVANQPSESMVTIIAGGILVSSFIPIFVKALVKDDKQSAWKLASETANLIFLIMSLLGIIEIVFAGPIVKVLLGTGFSADKQALTIELLRIQAVSIVFFGLSGLLVGILNSHQKFLMSALSPAMYNLGQIFGVYFLAPRMGIHGLAWGVVIGSAFSLLIQIPTLLRLRGSYSLSLGLRNSSVHEVFRLMAPRMFGAAAVQLMVWVNTLLASTMPDGSVYSLRLGFSIMMIAWAIVAQSIATAVMPTFATQFAQGRQEDIRATLSSVIRSIFLLSFPAAAGMILLRIPIITLVFQRREFTAETTRMVAWALLWYTAGLIFHSLLEVIVRAFYAMHDTRTPVLVGAGAMLLSIVFSFSFSALFDHLGWMPHGGLALAVSLATAMESITLYMIIYKRLKGLVVHQIAKGLATAVAGTSIMAITLLAWQSITRTANALVVTLGGILIGALVYGLVMLVLRIPEINILITAIKGRLLKEH